MISVKKVSEFFELSYIAERAQLKNGLFQSLSHAEKALFAIVPPFAVILVDNAYYSLFVLFIALFLSLLSHLSISSFMKRTLFFIPLFSLAISVPKGFLVEGNTFLSFSFFGHSLALSDNGLHYIYSFTLRVWAALSFPVSVTIAAGLMSLLKGLEDLGFPRAFTEVATYSYLSLYSIVKDASKASMSFTSRTPGKMKLKDIGNLFGSVLVRELSRGERTYFAYASRGLGHLSLRKSGKRLSVKGILLLSAVLAPGIAIKASLVPI